MHVDLLLELSEQSRVVDAANCAVGGVSRRLSNNIRILARPCSLADYGNTAAGRGNIILVLIADDLVNPGSILPHLFDVAVSGVVDWSSRREDGGGGGGGSRWSGAEASTTVAAAEESTKTLTLHGGPEQLRPLAVVRVKADVSPHFLGAGIAEVGAEARAELFEGRLVVEGGGLRRDDEQDLDGRIWGRRRRGGRMV